MLVEYLQIARRLLNDATFARVNDFDLRDYINIGRRQVAAQSEALPANGTLAVNGDTQQYKFSAIDFPSQPGIGAPISARMVTWQVGDGAKLMSAREWPWFNSWVLSKPAPLPGPPREWSQYGRGTSGSLFVNKLDSDYTLNIDAICLPVDLVDDATVEALPALWTDAVPFYAAYYWLLGDGQLQPATGMLNIFTSLMSTAGATAIPSVLPGSFPGASDPVSQNRLGIHPAAQRGTPTAQGG
jgi:hypothetical protein